MPADPKRHDGGPASATRTAGRATEESPDPPREATHVESSGHVERELPDGVGDPQGAKGAWQNEGEGNKTADRAYRKGTEKFVRTGRVEEQAQKAAEALDADEGPELRKAEDKGRTGKPRTKPR
jgi:hypothetical protein